MGTVRKTISLTENQDSWVKSKVASGLFASESEVHRALVKDLQTREAKLQWLRTEIEKGMNSPVIDRCPREIFAEIKAEVEAEMRAKGEL